MTNRFRNHSTSRYMASLWDLRGLRGGRFCPGLDSFVSHGGLGTGSGIIPAKMSEATIRQYTPADYADVRKNLEEGRLFYEPMDSEEQLTRLHEQSPQSLIVAEQDGTVVGNVIVLHDWGPLVFRLAVRKEFRNRGIGTQLMEAAEEQVRSEGFREIHLMVDAGDIEVLNYYRKRQYKEGHLYRWMSKEL